MCVLTPFGSRIHIPWAMAVSASIRAAGGPEVETLWGDDGFVLRFPDTDEPPDADWILVESAEAMQLVLRQLGRRRCLPGVSVRPRAAHCCCRAAAPTNARRCGNCATLLRSAQRGFAVSVVSAAARGLSRVPARRFRHAGAGRNSQGDRATEVLCVHVVETRKPSPFASSLLFSYVANFLYDGDAPLAERRAQALPIDQEQLRELLGVADLCELEQYVGEAKKKKKKKFGARAHRFGRGCDGARKRNCLQMRQY